MCKVYKGKCSPDGVLHVTVGCAGMHKVYKGSRADGVLHVTVYMVSLTCGMRDKII